LPTTAEQKALYYVLDYMLTSGLHWMRHRVGLAEEPYKVANGKYDAITANELSTLLLHGNLKASFEDTKVIFFEPPPKEIGSVAALWCRWNYEAHLKLPRCGFYFGIWSSERAFPLPNGNAANDLHVAFIGYRFETPEDGTNHNFYHAQPCRSMGRKDDEIEVSLPVSSRMPTWPLGATSALELLLCLVASLYGMDGLRELRNDLFQEPSLRTNPELKAAMLNVLSLGFDMA